MEDIMKIIGGNRGMKGLLLAGMFLCFSPAFSQTADLTPVVNASMHTADVEIPQKFKDDFTSDLSLTVPANYKFSVFHAGSLIKPRFMAFSQDGVLHVSDMGAGKVWALPDTDKDGVADTMITAASGFSGNHDVVFYQGAMYVTEKTQIWKCTDEDDDGVYETKTIFISNIGNSRSGHTTRTLVFDSLNHKAYVSIGSSCNVCREEERAIIEQYNDDGTGGRVFATGIRNAVGMAIHPVTHQLWANNNGSDLQGNEIPPEWIDIIRDGGFYGHPFAYGSGVWFDFNVSDYNSLLPITAADSSRVETMMQPAGLLRAHSAPMAIEFLNEGFGEDMQHGFLTALRGSWNTTSPNAFRGYKVVYGHLSSDQDTTVDYFSDFCSGFLTDSVNRVFWGRPVGIATDNEGRVYISSDDGNKLILLLTPANPTGSDNLGSNLNISDGIYPNPAGDYFTLPLSLSQSTKISAILYNIRGKEILRFFDQTFSSGQHDLRLDVSGIPSGSYFIKLITDEGIQTQKIVLLK